MDNLALQLIDHMVQEDAPFVIDSDAKTEWALRKIAEERADTQRIVNVCETMILQYQEQIKKANEQLDARTGYIREQLRQYFESVPHKATKTQETYKLPAGTLKLKIKGPEYQRDEAVLLKWAKENAPELVKVKETPNWEDLKKTIQVKDGAVITADGLIVDGVTAVDRAPEFIIEI